MAYNYKKKGTIPEALVFGDQGTIATEVTKGVKTSQKMKMGSPFVGKIKV